MDLNLVLAGELKINKNQVEKTVTLLDEGCTIPFIARYRKEVTGNLDEEVLRNLDERLKYIRNLNIRKDQVIASIEEQGKLTSELKKAIMETKKLQDLEDLYLPYRPKKKTKASVAREKGLLPVADLMLDNNITKTIIDKEAVKFIDPDKELNNIDDVILWAKYIVAEKISENATVRQLLREIIQKEATVCSSATDSKMTSNYEIYYDYSEIYSTLPPHRILAINRGEREKFLKVSLEIDPGQNLKRMAFILGFRDGTGNEYFWQALEDSFKRLLKPSIEREMRKAKTEIAERKAIEVFSQNLKNLLLQKPLKGNRIAGIDPGFRTGCKVAAIDEMGNLLTTATIYPTTSARKKEEAKEILKELLIVNNIKLIALGNGTACRETEAFLVEIMNELPGGLAFTIVNEAGASVYSASPLAKKEFPEMDVSMRGAVSIARRLQDPMAELVKIDPKSIGVGMYQHDVNQKELAKVLGDTVESVVNSVGVNLNTASSSLLEYVSGINSKSAKNIISYRQEKGKFKNRQELLKVPGFGEKTFMLCSGFLRIPDGDNPLDNTPIHPEVYAVMDQLLDKLGISRGDLSVKNKEQVLKRVTNKFPLSVLSKDLGIGEPTLKDILEALERPGRDPREDIPPPVFRRDILSIDQLQPDMILKGTVRNVVDFGAFMDIGVKRDGLVHISEMSPMYVKHPCEIVSVGQVLDVRVLSVDKERERISLSLI